MSALTEAAAFDLQRRQADQLGPHRGSRSRITVPTLVIGATHDTMDPTHMEMIASRIPKGRFHLCPNGSHMAMYDDQQTYFDGLIGFIRDVEREAG